MSQNRSRRGLTAEHCSDCTTPYSLCSRNATRLVMAVAARIEWSEIRDSAARASPAFAALKPGYTLIGAFAATSLRDKTEFRFCRPRT